MRRNERYQSGAQEDPADSEGEGCVHREVPGPILRSGPCRLQIERKRIAAPRMPIKIDTADSSNCFFERRGTPMHSILTKSGRGWKTRPVTADRAAGLFLDVLPDAQRKRHPKSPGCCRPARFENCR